jgi:hypothetical protein
MKTINWTRIYKKYKGLWVALKHDEQTVVGSGNSAKEALEDARRNGYTQPILMNVPTEVVTFAGMNEILV